MRLLSLRNLILFFTMAMLAVACDDSSTGGMENSDAATFTGRVESTSSQQTEANKSADQISAVEGAVVTAAQVTAEGELQTIGDAEAQTDAEGEYSLQVDVSSIADPANQIVIIATNNEETAQAIVSAEVQNGNTIAVQPINLETSAEVAVYQNVAANGNTNIVSTADISVAVESEVAADIKSNTQNAADVAAALASSAQAKATYYTEKGIEVSEDQRNQIAQIKHDAQVQLEAELNAAAAGEKQAAVDAFLQRVAKAEVEAGVATWAAAESNDLAARVLVKQSADLSTDAQSEIRKQAYFLTAVTIDAAVRAEAEAAGASEETLNALADAGATLQADIRTATNASKDQIDSFYVTFNESVQNAINSDSSLNGSAFVSANTAISGSSGLKNTLSATLNATADVNTMLSAYSAFSSGIRGVVE